MVPDTSDSASKCVVSSQSGTPMPSFEDTCVALARVKMARASKMAQGDSQPIPALEEELALVGRAMQTCNSDEDRAVLSEFWDEIDETLVSVLALPAGEEELLDQRLPAPGEVAEWKGAESESRAALRAVTSETGWSMPFPVLDDEPALPLPTPCRSQLQSRSTQQPLAKGTASAQGNVSGHPSTNVTKAAEGGSFRTASELAGRPKPPPQKDNAESSDFDAVSRSIVGRGSGGGSGASRTSSRSKEGDDKGREWGDEWLRIADPDQLERIVPALEATIHRANEAQTLTRNDIAGLEFVKSQIEEVLILPQLHPHLFASALTRPARGLLLFGPPGTGKTLLARWIAAECGATFFNINASSVLSKWIGEAEKTVKALFQLATERQPSVIFIDEIDSLLSQRRDADNESSRRVKNEFLTSLEGADTVSQDKVLLVGATNMPWELDPAALRRLPKRLYVPLPGQSARLALLDRQLTKHNENSGLSSALGPEDLTAVVTRTEGFSGSDLQVLLNEAAMGPVREVSAAIARELRKRNAPGDSTPMQAPQAPRNINMRDFECALRRVKPSFNDDQAAKHREFNEEHGTCRGEDAMHDSEEIGEVERATS